MKNSFDRLIDGLAKDYGMPSFLEIGQLHETNADAMMSMLYLNSFSFRKPFFTLGLNSKKIGELHARTPLLEVDNVQMREVFENLLVYCLKNKCSVKSSMLAR
ncbi:type III chaperone protein ShcF [Pseudomonas syringae pv. actinidiae ICMP 19102]|uniref:hypothetical protein n=1 Tax=Pseudomonas syringae TaxID=317 RepID=UPI000357610B|nr:hypothetical protein [Pseudomonas syringae]EPN00306.1 type III chaperone protein ShcF [Pseudomonas syringae pv. actinidiae ICMP 19102]